MKEEEKNEVDEKESKGLNFDDGSGSHTAVDGGEKDDDDKDDDKDKPIYGGGGTTFPIKK